MNVCKVYVRTDLTDGETAVNNLRKMRLLLIYIYTLTILFRKCIATMYYLQTNTRA